MYVNGNLENSISTSNKTALSATPTLKIAYDPGIKLYTKMTIYSVRIYNRVLSASEIKSNYDVDILKYK